MPNLRDPSKFNPKGKTSLFDVLDSLFDTKSRSIRTCQPAIVLEVDTEKNLVTLQPIIRTQKDNSGEVEVQDNVLYEVPIAFSSARNGRARLSMPVQKDTVGVVHYCERSTENWINSDGKTLQNSGTYNGVGMDGKLHPLYFVPEIFTPQSARRFDPNDIVLDYDDSEIRIAESGNITLSNSIATTTYEGGTVTTTNENGSHTLSEDGSQTLTNSGGATVTLSSDGNIDITGNTVTINGVVFSSSGSVTLPSGQTLSAPTVAADTSLTIDGTEMNGHEHEAGTLLLDGGGGQCTGQTGEPV